MKISDEALEEFQKIWKSEKGEDISLDEARECGEKFLGLFKIIYENGS